MNEWEEWLNNAPRKLTPLTKSQIKNIVFLNLLHERGITDKEIILALMFHSKKTFRKVVK